MNRMWKEPLILVLLGLASIGVVLSIRQLASPAKSGGADHKDSRNDEALAKQLRESKNKIDSLERRLNDTEEKLQDVEQRRSEENTTSLEKSQHLDVDTIKKESVSKPATSARYQDALGRAWQYLQAGKFDASAHREILLDLEAAYAIRGLPPEANFNLVKAIERMNDLGVLDVIDRSRELSPEVASELLHNFIDTTPRLSSRQRAQIKTAITDRKHGK